MFKKREKKAKTISVEDEDTTETNTDNNSNIIQPQIGNSKTGYEYLNKKRGQFSTKDSNQNEIVKEMLNDFKYKSNYVLQNVNTATREIEIDTELDKDATAIRLRNIQIGKDKLEGKIKEDTYMGKDATIVYAEKSERDLSRYKVTGSLGPMRAPTNLRAVCRFDYAHGICKDYKETGYCGFGDNCVFSHDRSDYKTGWEEEEDWRREQIRKQKLIKEGKYVEEENDKHSDYEDLNEDELKIPEICQICNDEFSSPVSTKCLHYFCEKCAMSHYAKSSLCFVCKKPTQGIFNMADKLINKIKERRIKNKNRKNNNTYENEKITKDVLLTEENAFNDNLDYLNRENRIELLEEEDEFGFKDYKNQEIKKKKKKNNFKVQNGLEFISDYKSY